MNNENILKERIAENLKKYRKSLDITQTQLAEKLNYSDKSVSKWERGEAIPDVLILHRLAEFYGITVNDFLNEELVKPKKQMSKSQFLITLISFTGVWVIATAVFVVFSIIGIDNFDNWLVFIYATVLSLIVVLVFSEIWGNHLTRLVSVSLLLWSIVLAFDLSFPNSNLWLLYIAAIPLQIIILLSSLLRKK